MLRKYSILLCVLLVHSMMVLPAYAVHSKTAAASVLVVDGRTNEELFIKKARTKRPVASTVKIMTALIVFEQGKLDQKIKVSKKAAFTQASKVYLKQGVFYTARDLLKAMLLESANDASVALAEGVAGTEWEFVKMMNKRAKELGAKNTFFANSHGLPDKKLKQYSTAEDMILILKEALTYPELIDMLSLKECTMTGSDGKKIALKSHNKMLWRDSSPRVYGKTGFTRAARHCFLGFYTPDKNFKGIDKRGSKVRLFAMFGSPHKLWSEIEKIVIY